MDIEEQLLIALSLILVFEGIVPFLYPQRWRQLVHRLAGLDDRQLRLAGLVSMLAGVALLYLSRYISADGRPLNAGNTSPISDVPAAK